MTNVVIHVCGSKVCVTWSMLKYVHGNIYCVIKCGVSLGVYVWWRGIRVYGSMHCELRDFLIYAVLCM